MSYALEYLVRDVGLWKLIIYLRMIIISNNISLSTGTSTVPMVKLTLHDSFWVNLMAYAMINYTKYQLTGFWGLSISLCSTFTCTSASDPLLNSCSQIGHWYEDVPGPGVKAMALVKAKVALSVGLSSSKVAGLAFALPKTDGEVRSKWARLMCSSNFLGHVDLKSHRRHWKIGKCWSGFTAQSWDKQEFCWEQKYWRRFLISAVFDSLTHSDLTFTVDIDTEEGLVYGWTWNLDLISLSN